MRKNYTDYYWHNQNINNQLVNSVRVRIYKVPDSQKISDFSEFLINTDGNYVDHYFEDFSYVIASTHVVPRFNNSLPTNNFYLHIKLFITSDFDITKLNNIEFMEKSYLVAAWKRYQMEYLLRSKLEYTHFIKILKNAVQESHSDFETVYNTLIELITIKKDINAASVLLSHYDITGPLANFFWKECLKIAIF